MLLLVGLSFLGLRATTLPRPIECSLKVGDLEVVVRDLSDEAASELTARVKGKVVYHSYEATAGFYDLKAWNLHPGDAGSRPDGFSFEIQWSTGSRSKLVIVTPQNAVQWGPALQVDLPTGRLNAPEWADLAGDGALEIIVPSKGSYVAPEKGDYTLDLKRSTSDVYRWLPTKRKFGKVATRPYVERLKPIPKAEELGAVQTGTPTLTRDRQQKNRPKVKTP